VAEAVAHPYPDTADAAPVAGRVDFPELVWEHWQWERELHTRGRACVECAARYQAALEAFEKRHGSVVQAFWSTTDASAAAVTVRRPALPLRLLGKESDYRLHLAGDWVIGRSASPLAEVLHRCEAIGIQAGEVLRGSTERVAMQLDLSVAAHVLGYIDRREGAPDAEEALEVAARQHAELDRVEAYYQRAANKAARIVYSAGMVLGLLWVVVAAILLAMLFELFGLFAEPTRTHAHTFFACFGLGALGAFVSVLTRMSQRGKFVLEPDLGRSAIRRVAALRPLVGAVFGSVAFLIVESGLLQIEKTFFVAATTAFVAGFSERWTRMALAGVGGRLAGEAEGGRAAEPEAERVSGVPPSDEELARPRSGE
jgi:hypothetical protein